jgi:predicted aconitase
MVGVTPEARTREEAFGGRAPQRRLVLEPGALEAAYRSFLPESDTLDLVVFSAPQLSLDELRVLGEALAGKQVNPAVKLLATTNYHNRFLAERLGYLQSIEDAGGLVVAGCCFYLMTPNELRERFGYRTLVTNSAKLANIISGYGYVPVFRPFAVCVEAAITGRIPW